VWSVDYVVALTHRRENGVVGGGLMMNKGAKSYCGQTKLKKRGKQGERGTSEKVTTEGRAAGYLRLHVTAPATI